MKPFSPQPSPQELRMSQYSWRPGDSHDSRDSRQAYLEALEYNLSQEALQGSGIEMMSLFSDLDLP